jgi:hypothetical protein
MNIGRFRIVAEFVALIAVTASLMAVVYELRQTQAGGPGCFYLPGTRWAARLLIVG